MFPDWVWPLAAKELACWTLSLFLHCGFHQRFHSTAALNFHSGREIWQNVELLQRLQFGLCWDLICPLKTASLSEGSDTNIHVWRGFPVAEQTEEPFCVKGVMLGLLRISGPAAGSPQIPHCVLVCLPTVQRVISTWCQGQKGPVRTPGNPEQTPGSSIQNQTSEEVITHSLSDSTPLANTKWFQCQLLE